MNREITFDEFCELPIIGNYGDKILKVTDAQEIVSFVKGVDHQVGVLRIGVNPEDVNYVGCSHNYVIEKINLAISALQWVKSRVKEADKIRADNIKLERLRNKK